MNIKKQVVQDARAEDIQFLDKLETYQGVPEKSLRQSVASGDHDEYDVCCRT